DGELPLQSLPDVRMVVAVAGRPPRGDAVDQFAPVGENDAAALGARHLGRPPQRFHLGVRQPDMVPSGLGFARIVHRALYSASCPPSTNSQGASSPRWSRRTCAAPSPRRTGSTAMWWSAAAAGCCRSPATTAWG